MELRTKGIVGIGGELKVQPEDFLVEEVPLYEPSGGGDHTYAWIEKRGVTTQRCIRQIAKTLGIRAKDIGCAGLKDRHAVTRQWLSLPGMDIAQRLQKLELEGIQVLKVSRHRNKLKTGHLKGNRFVIRVRNCDFPAEEAAALATKKLCVLQKPPWVLSWYGTQRFGTDNVAQARELLRSNDGVVTKSDRFLVSALQSHIFNHYLAIRQKKGLLATVIPGDVMAFLPDGKVFSASEDLPREQARMLDGGAAITGPMFGTKFMEPAEGTPARLLEDEALAASNCERTMFSTLGRLARGSRRILSHRLKETSVEPLEGSDIGVSFTLRAGMYATEVMREITSS